MQEDNFVFDPQQTPPNDICHDLLFREGQGRTSFGVVNFVVKVFIHTVCPSGNRRLEGMIDLEVQGDHSDHRLGCVDSYLGFPPRMPNLPDLLMPGRTVDHLIRSPQNVLAVVSKIPVVPFHDSTE